VPETRIPVDVIKGVPVVAAPAEIDITNAAELRAALVQTAAAGHTTLVVDMTGTRFCDSAGLHVLVHAHKRARAGGGELLLALHAAELLRVLEITGIDQMVPACATLDEALARAVAVNDPNRRPADDAAGEGSPPPARTLLRRARGPPLGTELASAADNT
jgi:anti-sigma B factor antagonist